ncbi:MAG: thermostable hemolysin [Alcanivoracaceae bacterium]|nr:thermostable hemolysin [Alcanivoracaceae bacterium]
MTNIQAVATNQINNILHYSPRVNKVLENKVVKNEYRIELVSKASSSRNEVEAFIQASYQKHFSAHLSSFFPLILSITRISDNTLLGAVGLRYADDEKLFSECYVREPIEDLIFASETDLSTGIITRNKIVELGNFVVRKNTDIKTVVPMISKFIKSLDVEWSVYTLTRPIKTHFQRLGIELCFLKDANLQAVNGAAADWGDYYSFQPAVYYSNVKNNMNQDENI